jgi:hypothetical protein
MIVVASFGYYKVMTCAVTSWSGYTKRKNDPEITWKYFNHNAQTYILCVFM